MKFGNQSCMLRVKAGDVHQAKSGQQLFSVVESGVGSMPALANASCQSAKLCLKMRASDDFNQRGSRNIPRTTKNGEDQLQGGVYVKKFTM